MRKTLEEPLIPALGEPALSTGLGGLLAKEQENHESDSNMISLTEGEKQSLPSALKMANWNISEASNLLGISRTTLYQKLKNTG